MTFIIGILQFYCKSEHKQVSWNEFKRDMSKSDSIFPYLKRDILLKLFWNLNFDKVYLKNEW